MTAAELLHDLRQGELWAPARTTVHVEEDGSSLEVTFPLSCPNGSVLWRRSALVTVTYTDTDTGGECTQMPSLFFDYLHEWNVSRIAVLSDKPFAEDVRQLEDQPRVVLIDLTQEPCASADRADIVEGLVDYLHPAMTDAEISDILDGMAEDQGRPEISDFDLCVDAVDQVCWAVGLVAACAGPHTDFPGSIEMRDAYVIHGLHSGEHHIYVDFNRLHRLLWLHASIADRARRATTDRDFWDAAARLGRTLAEFAFRMQHARTMADTFERVLQRSRTMRDPFVQRTLAAGLPHASLSTLQRILDRIRMLQLDGDALVDALREIATGPANVPAVFAVRTLGQLRAGRARETVETLTRHRRQAMREEATTALKRIDGVDDPGTPVTLTGAKPQARPTGDQAKDPAEPEQRFFRGPKDTIISVTNMSDDWSMCMTTTTHPDGTRDLAMGPFMVWRGVAAQLLGLIPPPPDEQMVKMGEAVTFDNDGTVVRRHTFTQDGVTE